MVNNSRAKQASKDAPIATARMLRSFHWKTGVKVALAVAIITLIANLTIVLIGVRQHGGYSQATGTLNVGDGHNIAKLASKYHILINVLSTILLTSSNYSMQLICAPTRKDVDKAHRQGKSLEIGVLSPQNLYHIPRQKAALWLLLAISSIPLHLL
jgi:hypothetical protein